MQAFFFTARKPPASCELQFLVFHAVTLSALGKLTYKGQKEWDKGKDFPLTEGIVGWDIGKKLFPVSPWHRLPREAVAV